MDKYTKRGLTAGLVVGVTLELFSLSLAVYFRLYGLREFGEGLINISFSGLIIFPLFTALLGGLVGHAIETTKYWRKGVIIGFFIMFIVFVFHSVTAPKSGEQWGHAGVGMILLASIPIAMIQGAIIGFFYGKWRKSKIGAETDRLIDTKAERNKFRKDTFIKFVNKIKTKLKIGIIVLMVGIVLISGWFILNPKEQISTNEFCTAMTLEDCNNQKVKLQGILTISKMPILTITDREAKYSSNNKIDLLISNIGEKQKLENISFGESKNVEVIGYVRAGGEECLPYIQKVCIEGKIPTSLEVVSINFLDR